MRIMVMTRTKSRTPPPTMKRMRTRRGTSGSISIMVRGLKRRGRGMGRGKVDGEMVRERSIRIRLVASTLRTRRGSGFRNTLRADNNGGYEKFASR
jgi:hypothetical protein